MARKLQTFRRLVTGNVATTFVVQTIALLVAMTATAAAQQTPVQFNCMEACKASMQKSSLLENATIIEECQRTCDGQPAATLPPLPTSPAPATTPSTDESTEEVESDPAKQCPKPKKGLVLDVRESRSAERCIYVDLDDPSAQCPRPKKGTVLDVRESEDLSKCVYADEAVAPIAAAEDKADEGTGSWWQDPRVWMFIVVALLMAMFLAYLFRRSDRRPPPDRRGVREQQRSEPVWDPRSRQRRPTRRHEPAYDEDDEQDAVIVDEEDGVAAPRGGGDDRWAPARRTAPPDPRVGGDLIDAESHLPDPRPRR